MNHSEQQPITTPAPLPSAVDFAADVSDRVYDMSHRMAETLFAVMDISVGLWLFLPYHTLATFPYSRLSAMFPEAVWGVIFLLIGNARLYGAKYDVRFLRSFGAWWGTIIYAVIAWTLVSEDWAGLGTPVFGALAMKNFFVYVLRIRKRIWRAQKLTSPASKSP